MAETQSKRRCVAQRQDGQPCGGWSMRESERALCVRHQEWQGVRVRVNHVARLPGNDPLAPLSGVVLDGERTYYVAHYDDEELALTQSGSQAPSLQGEVGLVRIALQRLLEDFGVGKGRAGPAMNARANMLFKGAELVARLLLAQERLASGGQSRVQSELEAAFAEFAAEFELGQVDEPPHYEPGMGR